MKNALLTALLLTLTISSSIQCKTSQPSANSHAFYYWKSSFYMDAEDEAFFRKHQINKLYIKFFDVEFDREKAVPAGDIYFNTAIPDCFLSIVPVVFITNETILKMDSARLSLLAEQISNRITKEVARTRIEKKVSEFQIDCDWTAQSRDRFFYLLNVIKEKVPYTLSATVRLHQYKYSRNNIPPVKKGLLMCYNINDPALFDSNNSIFTYDEVMNYIKDVKYPLELDIALPVFGWLVTFNGQKQFTGFRKLEANTNLKTDTNFTATERPDVFLCKQTTPSYDFYEGQYVRIEEVNLTDVLKVKEYLKDRVKGDTITFSFFSYDKQYLRESQDEKLEKLLGVKP